MGTLTLAVATSDVGDRPFDFGLHCAALFGLGSAQPLYDLMARHPEFFVAHRVGPAALVIGSLVWSCAVPGALFLLYSLSRPLGRTATRVAKGTIVAGLCGLGLLPLLENALGLPAAAVLGCAAAGGCGLAALYLGVPLCRRFLTWLAPTALLFPALFLFASPVSSLVLPEPLRSPTAPAPGSGAASSAPVFLIVFDELSTAALLDDDLEIDGTLYPHFARLRRGAHWFRNATTVSHGTTLAVPAIVAGRFPERGRLPIASAYPDSLLSLIAPTHRVKAFETVTDLCPPSVCTGAGRRVVRPSSSLAVVSDLLVVYGHLVTPAAYRERLPSLAGRWAGFTQSDREHSGAATDSIRQGVHRVELFEEFVAAIEPGPPALYFVHVLLPHVPYQFVGDGRFYQTGSDLPGWLREEESWQDDPVLVAQAYQRFLVQLQFVDTLLGRFLEKLDRLGLYDDALIVVTADHGVNFEPGETRRGVSEGTAATLLAVPVLLKEPGQQQGQVHDANYETIDILPTMAEVLGMTLPDLAGSSGLAATGEARPHKRFLFYEEAEFAASILPELRAAAARKHALFGEGGLFDHGPLPALHGRLVSDFARRPEPAGSAVLREAWRYDDVAAAARFVPSLVRGEIELDAQQGSPPMLAIAVNGRVEATTRAFLADEALVFSALIRPAAFREGRNDVEVFVAAANDEGTELVALEGVGWRLPLLAEGWDGETLRLPDGRRAAASDALPRGGFDIREQVGDGMHVAGWVAERTKGGSVRALLFYERERHAATITRFLSRPDVAEAVGESFLETGFDLWIESPSTADPAALRAFAVFADGSVAELGSHRTDSR